MYISGKSTHDIAAYLDKKGYKTRTGKQFYNKFICGILKNQIYTGKIVWNKKHYDKNQKTKKHYKYIKNDPSKILVSQGRHKPIIDEIDFAEVQKLLANKTRTWRPRAKNQEYLLTSLITCAKCNHRYTGVSSISNHRLNRKKRWYCCSGSHSSLRDEQESLKKLLAGYELRELERERSEGYINRVKDFLDGHDDSKEKPSFADKKQLAGLLFKNIKIASCLGGRLPPLIFCFQKRKEKHNVKRIKRLQKYAKENLHPYIRMGVVHLIDARWQALRRRWWERIDVKLLWTKAGVLKFERKV